MREELLNGIDLDKGKVWLKDSKCVNSNWTARFLCGSEQEGCQCSFGVCKVKVEIAYNGHDPHTYILTEKEIQNLLTQKP